MFSDRMKMDYPIAHHFFRMRSYSDTVYPNSPNSVIPDSFTSYIFRHPGALPCVFHQPCFPTPVAMTPVRVFHPHVFVTQTLALTRHFQGENGYPNMCFITPSPGHSILSRCVFHDCV